MLELQIQISSDKVRKVQIAYGQTPILQGIRSIEVREVSEELLEAVVRHPGLRELDMLYTNMNYLKPGILASLVMKMEKIALCPSGGSSGSLTPQQLTSLCQQMKNSGHMKSLHLERMDISSVEPKLLADAVSTLEEVNLTLTELTARQVNDIFLGLQTNTRMKSLNLTQNDLSTVDPNILGDTVSRISKVDLGQTRLTTQQATSVCSAQKENTALTSLNLRFNNLSSVNPTILSEAVSTLSKVDLSFCQLNTHQVLSLCAVLKSETELTRLDLTGNNLVLVLKEVLQDPRLH